MDVLYPRCAGLDVHKDVVVACVRIAQSGGQVSQDVRSFATTTTELCELADWLNEREVTHVVMEASGVYWKPVWHVLEETLELVLANAHHVKNVPGRKSDVNDAMWLADLLAHGLVRGSFVPPAHIQEVRDLSRTRKQLTREIIQHTNRIQKVLEDANIKLASAISNVLGKSGRAILEAIIGGQSDPEKLVDLCIGRLKATRKELVEAMRGRVTAHHRFLLKLHLAQVDQLTAGMRELEARMGEILAPFQEHVDNLTTIPGVSDTTARVLAGEIGLDMSRFPTVGHLISWAGLCPKLDESAGKHRSVRIRKGAPWLKTSLISAAWAAVRTKHTYLRAQFARLKARRGAKKAIVAVAASMLTAAFHIIRDRVVYRELGADHFTKRDPAKAAKRLLKRLEGLGYAVEARPTTAVVSI
jgi:transposase